MQSVVTFVHLKAQMSILSFSTCDAKALGHQRGVKLFFFLRFTLFTDSRYVHVHTDSRSSPLTVHDGHGGDDVDQGGCQPAVQRPSTVGVLLFHPHPAHHLSWACGQDVHLGSNITVLCDSATTRTISSSLNTVCESCREVFHIKGQETWRNVYLYLAQDPVEAWIIHHCSHYLF